MISDKILYEIEEWAQEKLAVCDAGHDWWHIIRVRRNAEIINKQEKGNWDIVLPAVLLHDVADTKFFDEIESLMLIEQKLDELKIERSIIDHVLLIIQNMSFSKQWSDECFNSLELRIVQDADRLDAMGAIGIARAFSYGGLKGRDFYNPAVAPQTYGDAEAYRNSNSSVINHFYEKLLLLKERMNTDTGRLLAEDRHRFMEHYLERFFKEWGAE